MADYLRLIGAAALAVATLATLCLAGLGLRSTFRIAPPGPTCEDLGGQTIYLEAEDCLVCIGLPRRELPAPSPIFTGTLQQWAWGEREREWEIRKEVLTREARKVVCRIRGDLCDSDPALLQHF